MFFHSLGEGIALVIRLKKKIAAGEIASTNITKCAAVASITHASTPIGCEVLQPRGPCAPTLCWGTQRAL